MKAITRPLSDVTDRVPDLNDIAAADGTLFVRDGVGFAGRGVAARVPIDDATACCAAIDHDSTVDGVSPRAIGCSRSRPGPPAELIVPAIVIGKRADGATVDHDRSTRPSRADSSSSRHPRRHRRQLLRSNPASGRALSRRGRAARDAVRVRR